MVRVLSQMQTVSEQIIIYSAIITAKDWIKTGF